MRLCRQPRLLAVRYAERLDALEACWRVWAEIGTELSEEDWARPTRCDGWDVNAIFAHHAGYPMGLRTRPDAEPSGDVVTAVDVLRGYNVPGSAEVEAIATAVAEGARGQAATIDRGRLVVAFSEDAREALGWLRATPGETLFPWPGGPVSIMLAEAVRIVIMEATVHLYDVQNALGLERKAPATAEREVAQLLAEIPVGPAFIEAATGRSDQQVLPVIR